MATLYFDIVAFERISGFERFEFSGITSDTCRPFRASGIGFLNLGTKFYFTFILVISGYCFDESWRQTSFLGESSVK